MGLIANIFHTNYTSFNAKDDSMSVNNVQNDNKWGLPPKKLILSLDSMQVTSIYGATLKFRKTRIYCLKLLDF